MKPRYKSKSKGKRTLAATKFQMATKPTVQKNMKKSFLICVMFASCCGKWGDLSCQWRQKQ